MFDRVVIHEERGSLVFRVVVVPKGGIFPRGVVHNQAFALPVFWHVGNATVTARLAVGFRARQVEFNTVHDDRAGRLAVAAQHLKQFRLPVARNPGNAEDLASGDVEGNTFDPRNASSIHDPQVFDLKHIGTGFGGLFVDLQQDLAAHHELGQLLW